MASLWNYLNPFKAAKDAPDLTHNNRNRTEPTIQRPESPLEESSDWVLVDTNAEPTLLTISSGSSSRSTSPELPDVTNVSFEPTIPEEREPQHNAIEDNGDSTRDSNLSQIAPVNGDQQHLQSDQRIIADTSLIVRVPNPQLHRNHRRHFRLPRDDGDIVALREARREEKAKESFEKQLPISIVRREKSRREKMPKHNKAKTGNGQRNPWAKPKNSQNYYKASSFARESKKQQSKRSSRNY